MASYVIGIDYGSLSGRSVLVDAADGRVVASSAFDYPHGVLDRHLPDGTPLPADYALQHPQDYLDVLCHTIPRVLEAGGVSGEEVVGIGLDATACTVLPLDKQGQPLCRKYPSEPQAYIKMWKHHGAQLLADRLTRAAESVCPETLMSMGGSISAESFFPKLWELWEMAPRLYDEMYEYMEVADWIILHLTGSAHRNGCAAGYKAQYIPGVGYPRPELFEKVGFRPKGSVTDKMPSPVVPVGETAGHLSEAAAEKLGLKAGIPVAAGLVDAHVCVPAAGIAQEGQMLMIIGTSACHMVMGRDEKAVPGICGYVDGGIMPGFTGFEAGQSSVGDLYAWFVSNCVPAAYFDEAGARGMSIHTYLSELAKQKAPGETGLLALDWLNGNRSTLCNYDLSALVLGMTMQTKCEDIYRALVESTAFGCRAIVENFRKHGVPVDRFTASGGISLKNPFVMQVYSDVLNMPVEVIRAEVGPALGSAIFAAVAAGCYENIRDAAQAMKSETVKIYTPQAESASVYEALYREYLVLYEYFGRTERIMQRLRSIRNCGSGPDDSRDCCAE